MKIAGFTIIKNAIINDYPVVEAIQSILPVVDEMIVLIGKSEDHTEELIRSIHSDKIRIFHSEWDPALRTGGRVLAVETNKAIDLLPSDADWGFYIQADEAIHEKYHPLIRQEAERYLSDRSVEGLLFHFLHFYATYDYVGDSRKWYDKEIRMIRNDRLIRSYRDAQGFRKNGGKLQVKLIDAWVYHYGWVKDPQKMKEKMFNAGKLWHTDEEMKQLTEAFDYNDFDSLARFTDSHPSVMKDRIKRKNWELHLDISRKQFSLKQRMLYWLEKKTGRRLFDYKNYKLI